MTSNHENEAFTGPCADQRKAPRAIPIKPEEWERFRPYICSLYEEHSLKDVLQILEEELGFGVTKRQLVYKLETWGIRKYKKDAAISSHDPDAVDLIQPENLSPGIHHARKLAADFCSAVADDITAFQLGYELLQLALADTNANATYRDSLVILCARCAQLPGDTITARQLVSSYSKTAVTSISPLFFAILDFYMEWRQDIPSQNILNERLRHILALVADQSNTAANIPPTARLRDAAAYPFLSCITRGLRRDIQDPTTRRLCIEVGDNFFRYCFASPMYEAMTQNNHKTWSWLRACLIWCEEQLQNELVVPPEVIDLNVGTTHRHLRDNLQLFCGLWDACLNSLSMDGRLPEWCEMCEKDTAMTYTEVLLTASWMLGAQPRRAKFPISAAFLQKDYNSCVNIYQRAAINASEMTDLPEDGIWTYFLSVSVWLHEPVTFGMDDEMFEQEYLPKIRSYISSILKVALPSSNSA
ncbi:hypothetical protein HJFPF1_03225 [Paramyrothecium foliicola]|nr:hypothetical protein HJFPF1_03225 [Paramyrothecium foliicola]